MQRVLWVAFLICSGWTFLGLTVGLPLYLIDTPCLAQSSSQIQFGGQLSTLQDLSLLRLLTLLDNRTVTITSPKQLMFREIVNGRDFTPNVRARLIAFTVLAIVLGTIPMAWGLYREFNKLIRHRENWLTVKCGNADLAWLSSKHVPGFRGWGEQRLKEFLHKNGLGSSLIGGGVQNKQSNFALRRNDHSVEVAELFTIV
jgi:calcium permeable stress-gated cation channel